MPAKNEPRRQETHPNQRKWIPKELGLLGKMPDSAVARRIGVDVTTVRAERQRRTIPAHRPKRLAVLWSEGMLRVLGTDTDRNIGDHLGIPKHCVRRRRELAGILPYRVDAIREGSRKLYKWTKKALEMLGTDSDRRVATRLGITLGVVARKRALVGIPARYAIKRLQWTRRMVASLGKVSDKKLAGRFKVKPETVARKRTELGIGPHVDTRPWLRDARIKTALRLPMRYLQKRYRMSTETVANLRRELGVPNAKRIYK